MSGAKTEPMRITYRALLNACAAIARRHREWTAAELSWFSRTDDGREVFDHELSLDEAHGLIRAAQETPTALVPVSGR